MALGEKLEEFKEKISKLSYEEIHLQLSVGAYNDARKKALVDLELKRREEDSALSRAKSEIDDLRGANGFLRDQLVSQGTNTKLAWAAAIASAIAAVGGFVSAVAALL